MQYIITLLIVAIILLLEYLIWFGTGSIYIDSSVDGWPMQVVTKWCIQYIVKKIQWMVL